MTRLLARLITIAAVVALTACSNSATQSQALPFANMPAYTPANTDIVPVPAFLEGHHFYHACPLGTPERPECFAILSDAVVPNSSLPCTAHTPGCYGPADLQAAYGVTSLAKTGGNGQTVAIVDAFGYPNAAKDLAAYRKFWGLPACGAGCLTIVNQAGKTRPLPAADVGWDGEQALDLDMVSAMCPNCHIVLVQTNDSTMLYTGLATASKMAHIVSNSWGSGEFTGSYPPLDSHKGVVILASAGDFGAGYPAMPAYNVKAAPESQPCGFKGVICVGGTSLTMRSGKRVGEVVWDDLLIDRCGSTGTSSCGATGSGCSRLVAKPSWQNDKGCTKRSATDISANGDPLTGVVIACSPCAGAGNNPLFGGEGGTSESSPIMAGLFALAGNAATQPGDASFIWTTGKTKPTAFHDIVSGHNDKKGLTGLVCPSTYAYICNAGTGYDGPTGWGTPNGVTAL